MVLAGEKYVHKIDHPPLKRPLWIIRGNGRSGFDEKGNADLDAVQQTSYLWVGERSGPDLVIALPGNVAMNQFAGRFEILRVFALDGFLVIR
mgnify:CR=1 FL=1